MIQVLWQKSIPDFSLLWLSDPDLTQHNTAPGSPAALAAIKAEDDNLGLLLRALNEKHVRDTTDVLVVSDHGFSTIRRSIDLIKLLNDAGFHAFKELPETPARGDILLVGNGGTVLFYIHDHDRETAERLGAWLERTDFAGAIFAREKIEGAFPLSAIHIDTANAGDVVMAFRSSMSNNSFGVPGLIDADWNRPVGNGTHATLSRSDVHNTFIAAGPDFRPAFEDDIATGNIDIAPTILHLLNVKSDVKFDGRIVQEALRSSSEKPEVKKETLQATGAPDSHWQQSLQITHVGSTTYFDGATNSNSAGK
jgi:arylsulfatase A-like enzyme